jgi:hypothetical protein
MKKMVFCVIAFLMTVIACASSNTPVTATNTVPAAATNGTSPVTDMDAVKGPPQAEIILAQMTESAIDLDAAIKAAALKIGTNLPAKTEIALISLASTSAQLSEYIFSRLEAALVDDGKLVVLDRANLDRIREEQGFQLSGEVDDKSAKDIGKMLGAGAIVTGSFINLGDVYGLSLKAISMKTAAIAVSYPADIAKSTRIETLLASGGGSTGTGTRTTQMSRTSGNTTTAQPATPLIPVYKIGDTGPGGGKIFYVSEKGFVSNGKTCHYLEAAPRDVGNLVWSYNEIKTGATKTGIGAGAENTATVRTADSNAAAARACNMYSNDGKEDWFLPSKDELNEMYWNKAAIGGFDKAWYWSSSEGESMSVWAHDFGNGEQHLGNDNHRDSNNKRHSERVRAIRAF